MVNPTRVPAAPFGRIFTGEAAAFLAARGGEAIFKVVPQQVIDTVVDILPAGVLSTPDRQKDFARYAKMFALIMTRGDVVKGEIVQEFLTESLEEIANRQSEYEAGRGDRKKSMVQEVLNKRIGKLDKLRAIVSPVTAPGRNLWDTLSLLLAHKQATFWTWFQLQDEDFRKEVHESGAGIVVSEERLLSFIIAPDALKKETMEHLLKKSPKLGPSKSALERFFGGIRGKGEKYLEPDGVEMVDYTNTAKARASGRNDRVKARRRMF